MVIGCKFGRKKRKFDADAVFDYHSDYKRACDDIIKSLEGEEE